MTSKGQFLGLAKSPSYRIQWELTFQSDPPPTRPVASGSRYRLYHQYLFAAPLVSYAHAPEKSLFLTLALYFKAPATRLTVVVVLPSSILFTRAACWCLAFPTKSLLPVLSSPYLFIFWARVVVWLFSTIGYNGTSPCSVYVTMQLPLLVDI
jgi:hypothetical protein